MRRIGTWRVTATAVLALTGALASALPASAWTTAYGSVGAPDRTLRSGCHSYRFHYVVKPPTSDWLLETHLYDPRGKPRATNDFLNGSDPTTGHGHFMLCRSTVVPGRYTLRAQFTWTVPPSSPLGQPTDQTVSFKPSHFWLRRS